MRTIRAVSKVLALATIVGGAAGCPFPYGECPPENQTIPPGTAARGGIDPVPALDALGPQTLPLRWVEIDQTTTLTITTAAVTNQPSTAETGCEGGPSSYQVPGRLTFDTADGRLQGATATTTFEIDAKGALRRPVWLGAFMPASTLVGTGVAPDTLLETAGGSVAVDLQIVAAGAGVAYGTGSILLSAPDRIALADIGTAAP